VLAVALTTSFKELTFNIVLAVVDDSVRTPPIAEAPEVKLNYSGLDATTGGITFDVSLPIASNLAAADDLVGSATVSGSGLTAVNLSVSANTTNDRATVGGSQGGLVSQNGTITFTYTVI